MTLTSPTSVVRRSSRCLVTGLLCGLGMGAHAAVFQGVSQERSVQIGGELTLIDLESQQSQTVDFTDTISSLPGQIDLPSLRTGMNIELSGGACFGQGVALQTFSATGSRIEFQGVADVNVSGFAPYPMMLEGSGGATVRLNYQFIVNEKHNVMLVMGSQIALDSQDAFAFSLKASDGSSIWSATAIMDDDGLPQRNFSTGFSLDPGLYTIDVSLMASSHVSGGSGISGRSAANFSITALPEPETWLMAAVGLSLIAWRVRR